MEEVYFRYYKRYGLDLYFTGFRSYIFLCIIYINNEFKNFVISRLHFGMCRKSKLRVYRELKEDFEVQEVLTWSL